MERRVNMNTPTKIIHEFYYVVGAKDFANHYVLEVDKETEKMLYGNALNNVGNVYGRFAIKKSNLNEVTKIVDKRHGLVLRVQLKDYGDGYDAYEEAKNRVFEYLTEMVEDFIKYKREI